MCTFSSGSVTEWTSSMIQNTTTTPKQTNFYQKYRTQFLHKIILPENLFTMHKSILFPLVSYSTVSTPHIKTKIIIIIIIIKIVFFLRQQFQHYQQKTVKIKSFSAWQEFFDRWLDQLLCVCTSSNSFSTSHIDDVGAFPPIWEWWFRNEPRLGLLTNSPIRPAPLKDKYCHLQKTHVSTNTSLSFSRFLIDSSSVNGGLLRLQMTEDYQGLAFKLAFFEYWNVWKHRIFNFLQLD